MAPDFYILKSKTIPILDLYMVITMKKTVLFLMVIFLMIGVCGCDMKGQDKVDMMVSYINDKYSDDSFEYVSMSGGHLGSNTTKIIVKSEKYPDKEIRVICNEVNGENIYSDTYLNIKFETETYEFLRNALVMEYGENIYLKYIPDDTASCENGSSSTTFEEYVSDPSTYIYFSAAVIGTVDDEESTLNRIKSIFADAVISAHIYFVDTDDSLSDNANKLIENKEYAKRLYIIKETVDQYSKTEWTDGV